VGQNSALMGGILEKSAMHGPELLRCLLAVAAGVGAVSAAVASVQVYVTGYGHR
jgi:hypothetical protein